MNDIKIDEIQIIPIKARQGLVGFASCVVNEQFFIGNIAIHSTFDANEFRLVYPNKAINCHKAIPCVHPINKQIGEAMSKAICTAFKDLFIKYKDKDQIKFI